MVFGEFLKLGMGFRTMYQNHRDAINKMDLQDGKFHWYCYSIFVALSDEIMRSNTEQALVIKRIKPDSASSHVSVQ